MKVIEVESLADVHVHLREPGQIMKSLIQHSIAGGADVLGAMPNTKVALTTAHLVTPYMDNAKGLVLPTQRVSFLPFVMITERTTELEIDVCVANGIVDGKIYPFKRTTKSDDGIEHYERVLPIISYCGKVGMKCHFHPEHPNMLFINRDAEFVFLPIVRMLDQTDTIIVWEHGTDARCIPHWEDMSKSGRFFVTLTAHHLATNEDETFGDVRAVCKPPIKTEYDRRALVDLVGKNYPWVMAGTDTAFHPKSAKHVDDRCCACGDFTAPFAHPLYAHTLGHLLVTEDGIKTYVNFTSRNARNLHTQLPPSSRMVKLANEQWEIPKYYPVGTETALPFGGGQKLNWKIVG
jgi:dihydroorotase